MGRFDKKVVLIAGCKGAANEMAKIICAEGGTVIVNDPDKTLTDAIDAPVAEKLNYGLSMEDGRKLVEYLTGKCKTDDATKQMTRESEGKYPSLDVVIFNYDDYNVCKMRADMITVEAYRKAMDINVNSLFHLGGALREQFKWQGEKGKLAKLLLMSSIVGIAGISQLGSLYAAVKGAVNGLVRCIAKEYGRFACVNGIAQGFYAESKNLVGMKDRLKGEFTIITGTARAKADLKYTDVAKMAAYLVSDDADMISGQIIAVDGGLWTRVQA
ncbi:MAG: SDR family oxidoreductase [Candidatus Lokiarchaeota archaeon]|nr:SDR family oxidoreductase [Candidatus Lokiarchaeota archaeon]